MPAPAKIDLVQAYKLRVRNRLSCGEIAKHFDVSTQAVSQALQRITTLVHEPADHEAYQQVKPFLLSTVEERLLASLLDPLKLEKASLNNAAYAYQQVANQLRLETGQSTSNLGVLGKLLVETHQALKDDPRLITPQPVGGEPAKPEEPDVSG